MPLDADALFAAHQAAREAARSAGHWWRQLESAAGTAVSDEGLDSLVRDALEAMRELLGADEVSLLVTDETGSALVARASVGLGESSPRGLHIPAGAGMAGQVLAARKQLRFDDLRTTQLVSPTLRERGMLSAIAVPLLFEDRALGVMHAGSRRLAAFADDDAELLSVMAERLAVALERVRLFEDERRLRVAAEQLATRLARIQAVTAALAGASVVEDVAAAVGECVVSQPLGASQGRAGSVRSAALWLVDDESLDAVRTDGDAEGGAGTAGTGDRIALGAIDLLARAVGTRRILLESLESGTSRVAVPVTARGEPLGVLEIAFDGAAPSDEEELSFLGLVAEQVGQSLERIRLFTEQAELSAVSSFFARAARVTAEATGLGETLERLASIALPVLGDICLIDLLADDGTITRMVAQHRDPSRQHLVTRLRDEFPPDPNGHHPAVEVIRDGLTRWSSAINSELMGATTRSAEHLALTLELGFRSYLSVPLMTGAEVIGAVTLVSTGRPFRPGDVAFAERLAEQVAAVVGNARRYDATFQTSHLLQESLLPRSLPHVPGLEVQTRYLAASSGLDVGGDFYDLIVLPGSRVGLMVGDVAGHDGDAAAMMGHLRSAARALFGQVPEPGELVAALQWSWQLLGFERMATALFGRLDQRDGELVLASAGHYPPLLLRANAAHYLEVEPGPPLGALAAGERPSAGPEWRGTLEPGDVLLCYTDGAIDERRAGIDASMARLAEIATVGTGDPAALCDRVIGMLTADRRADDVALLALRHASVGAAPARQPDEELRSGSDGKLLGL